MNRSLALAVFVLAAAYGSANAQSNRAAQKPAPQPPAEQAAPAAPADAGSPAGSIRTERSVFDSWALTCQEVVGEAKSKRCSATLQIVDQQSKRVAFVWAMGRTPQGAPTAVFTTPTGINLAQGLELVVGKGKPRKLTFSSCDPSSCEAVMPLDEVILKDARSGDDAAVTIVMKDGRTVTFNIVNKGFEKALSAIRS